MKKSLFLVTMIVLFTPNRAWSIDGELLPICQETLWQAGYDPDYCQAALFIPDEDPESSNSDLSPNPLIAEPEDLEESDLKLPQSPEPAVVGPDNLWYSLLLEDSDMSEVTADWSKN